MGRPRNIIKAKRLSGRLYDKENKQQIENYERFETLIPALKRICIENGLTNEDEIFDFMSEGIDGAKAKEILDKFGSTMSSKLLENDRNKDIKFQVMKIGEIHLNGNRLYTT